MKDSWIGLIKSKEVYDVIPVITEMSVHIAPVYSAPSDGGLTPASAVLTIQSISFRNNPVFPLQNISVDIDEEYGVNPNISVPKKWRNIFTGTISQERLRVELTGIPCTTAGIYHKFRISFTTALGAQAVFHHSPERGYEIQSSSFDAGRLETVTGQPVYGTGFYFDMLDAFNQRTLAESIPAILSKDTTSGFATEKENILSEEHTVILPAESNYFYAANTGEGYRFAANTNISCVVNTPYNSIVVNEKGETKPSNLFEITRSITSNNPSDSYFTKWIVSISGISYEPEEYFSDSLMFDPTWLQTEDNATITAQIYSDSGYSNLLCSGNQTIQRIQDGISSKLLTIEASPSHIFYYEQRTGETPEGPAGYQNQIIYLHALPVNFEPSTYKWEYYLENQWFEPADNTGDTLEVRDDDSYWGDFDTIKFRLTVTYSDIYGSYTFEAYQEIIKLYNSADYICDLKMVAIPIMTNSEGVPWSLENAYTEVIAYAAGDALVYQNTETPESGEFGIGTPTATGCTVSVNTTNGRIAIESIAEDVAYVEVPVLFNNGNVVITKRFAVYKHKSLDGEYLPLSGGSLSGSLVVGGDLTVIGETQTINAVDIDVQDKTIILGNTDTPTDATANGGGIVLKGATDKTFLWDSTKDAWTTGQHVSAPTFVSTSTDTPPISVVSTQKIDNLNADLLDGKHASEFSLTTHNHDVTYSQLGHTHAQYALTNHSHVLADLPPELMTENEYLGMFTYGLSYPETPRGGEIHYKTSAIQDPVVGIYFGSSWVELPLATHTHDQYSLSSHDHNGVYAVVGHNHDSAYAALDHNHNSSYSALVHAHGNLTSDGKIGVVSDLVVVTTTAGALTTQSRSGIDSRTAFPPESHTHAQYALATSIGNGTLTLNVSGTGLSGSATFTANQSGAATFTVSSNATSANTASTIVARDASGNFVAGTISATLNGLADRSGYLISEDNRTISPSELGANRLRFGFSSWNNDDSSPYADFLHMRSYMDNSGGSDNLIMFKKTGIGVRVWQQAFGSTSPYSTYKDLAFTDGTNCSGTWGISITGNANTVTNGVYTTGSYSNPSWITALAWAKITGAPSFASSTHTHTAADLPANIVYKETYQGYFSTGATYPTAVQGLIHLKTDGGTPVAPETVGISFNGSSWTELALKVHTHPEYANASHSHASGDLPATIVYTSGSYSNPAWITSLAWSKITGAPSFALSTHDHDNTYLKLIGGTLSGNLEVGSGTEKSVLGPGFQFYHHGLKQLSFEAETLQIWFQYNTDSAYIGYIGSGRLFVSGYQGGSEQVIITTESQQSITLSRSPRGIEFITLSKNGQLLRRNIDYTLSAAVITLTANVDRFFPEDDVYVEYFY